MDEARHTISERWGENGHLIACWSLRRTLGTGVSGATVGGRVYWGWWYEVNVRLEEKNKKEKKKKSHE